jgi:drug/metabolite transporter (DMT)-like permease
MAPQQRFRAITAVLLATVMWSTGGVLVKWVTSHPLTISGLRSLIAIPVLLLFLRRPRFTWSVPQIGAAVAYSATVIAFVIATKLTMAANAILLQYTSPIFVALPGGWLLGERTGWGDWLAIGVVLGGLVLFFLDRLSLSGLAGNLVAIGSGLSFAFLLIFLRQQKSGSPMESIVLGNILTAAIGLPFVFGHWPDRSGWLGIALLGTFQLGLPYALYSRGIRKVTALQAILIKGFEPILNPLWVYLFIGETPGRWALGAGRRGRRISRHHAAQRGRRACRQEKATTLPVNRGRRRALRGRRSPRALARALSCAPIAHRQTAVSPLPRG